MSVLNNVCLNRIPLFVDLCVNINKAWRYQLAFSFLISHVKRTRNSFHHHKYVKRTLYTFQVINYHIFIKHSGQAVMEGERNISGKFSKPPNIFVYTGDEDAKTSDCFKMIKERLSLCINPDSYLIYPLMPSQVNRLPWQENTSLLVISTDSLSEQEKAFALNFFENEGKVLILGGCSAKNKSLHKFDFDKWESVTTLRSDGDAHSGINPTNAERFVLVKGDHPDEKADIVKFTKNRGNIIISSVMIMMDPMIITTEKETFTLLKESESKRLEILRDILCKHYNLDCKAEKIPDPTPIFLLAKNGKVLESAIKTLSSRWSNKRLQLKKSCLEFVEDAAAAAVSIPTGNTFPVLLCTEPKSSFFNHEYFFQKLNTESFGHVVFYSDIVGSTMDLLDGMTILDGAVCVAARQTQGKGRGDNQWLSPPGCAMFTLHHSMPLQSKLGQSLSFIQHLTALALVSGIRSLSGYEDLDLKIKWPNDIYFGNRIKLGGVIVTSTLLDNMLHCYIGMGVNLSNRIPTMCINDVIAFYNGENADSLPLLRVEEVLALTFERLESLVEMVQKRGVSSCIDEYYKYWLHSNQELTLETTEQKVVVQGVDDCGYLVVRTEGGQRLTLMPDGNGLDLMSGMIVMNSKQGR